MREDSAASFKSIKGKESDVVDMTFEEDGETDRFRVEIKKYNYCIGLKWMKNSLLSKPTMKLKQKMSIEVLLRVKCRITMTNHLMIFSK